MLGRIGIGIIILIIIIIIIIIIEKINKITLWLMETEGSMPHSQVISNNPCPEPDQLNSSY